MTTTDWLERANSAELTVNNFINGSVQAISDSADAAITKHSPRDGSLLYSFSAGTSADVDAAVASAREAFNDRRWRSKTVGERAAIINKLADLVEANKEELALYESLDVGKCISKALNDDIPRTLNGLRGAASLAPKVMSSCGADLGHFAYQRCKPVGVVGGICGWNYPLTMAAGKMAPALMMGNCVVLKPSEFTSLSAQRLAALAIEAGVPPGVFNVVHGAGTTVGAALAAHNDVDLIAFVGSSATGRKIVQASGQSNMKRLQLECGGKSPFMIFDDCPEDQLDAIAADIVDTAFPNQGALCVAGTRLLIQESLREKLIPKIVEKAAAIKAGDPLDPDSHFGALVNEAHMNKVLGYIDSGLSEGAELILGGQRIVPEGDDALQHGFYIEPTIFDRVDPNAKIALEEIFGPVLSIISFKDEAEAIAIANNSSFGLAAYAVTTDLGRAQRLGEDIESGMLMVISNMHSHGGWVGIGSDKFKQSGFGFSGGEDGMKAYTQSTAVHILS